MKCLFDSIVVFNRSNTRRLTGRVFLVLCVCLLNTIVYSQECPVYLRDVFDQQSVCDAHVFSSDEILVSDKNGAFDLGRDNRQITISHTSYSDTTLTARCGDTIRLIPSIYALEAVELYSNISRSRLKSLYRKYKKAMASLNKNVRGIGFAENSSYHHQRISEYKSFLFNYRQRKSQIREMTCVNAFTRLRKDSIYYFEGLEVLIGQLALSPRDAPNTLIDPELFHGQGNWELTYYSNGQTEVLMASKNGISMELTFQGDLLVECRVDNLPFISDLIERVSGDINKVRSSIAVRLSKMEDEKLIISKVSGFIDVDEGDIYTQFGLSFEANESQYLEPIIAVQKNARSNYLTYLMLAVDSLIDHPSKYKLTNSDQISEFVQDEDRIERNHFFEINSILPLEKSDTIGTGEFKAVPIILERNELLFLDDFYSLPPLVALYAFAYVDYQRDVVRTNLYLDQKNSSKLCFLDSDYNEIWEAKQMLVVNKLAKDLESLLINSHLQGLSKNQLSQKDWESLRLKVNEVVLPFVREDFLKTLRQASGSKYQNYRLLQASGSRYF